MRCRLESSSLSSSSSASSATSWSTNSSFYSANQFETTTTPSNRSRKTRQLETTTTTSKRSRKSKPNHRNRSPKSQASDPPSRVSQNREPSPISSISTTSSISTLSNEQSLISSISSRSTEYIARQYERNQSSNQQYSKPKSKWNNNTSSSSSQELSWSSESDSISSWSGSNNSQQQESQQTNPTNTNNHIPQTVTEIEFQSDCSVKSTQSSMASSPEKARMKWRGRQSSSSSLESINDQEYEDATTEDQVMPSAIDGCKCRLNMSTYNKHRKINTYQQHPIKVCQQGTTGTTANSQKTNHTINLFLEDEVQRLVAGISQKFVCAPPTKQAAIDLFEGIRRFKNAIRWKEFFRKKALQETNKMRVLAGLQELKGTDKEIDKLLNNQDEEQPDKPEGLHTGLHPSCTKMNAPKGSIRLEAFLHNVEHTILLQLDNYMDTYKDDNETSLYIKRVQHELQQNPNKIVAPTDKTNSFMLIDVDTCDEQVLLKEDRSDPTSVKSRTGFIICVANCPVIWCSKLQSTIATSSVHAEYIGLSTAVRDIIPLRNTLSTVATAFGLPDDYSTTFKTRIWEDNNGCRTIANLEPGRFTPASKWYDISLHWFRSHLNERITVERTDTKVQWADAFTKPLKPDSFADIRRLFMGWQSRRTNLLFRPTCTNCT